MARAPLAVRFSESEERVIGEAAELVTKGKLRTFIRESSFQVAQLVARLGRKFENVEELDLRIVIGGNGKRAKRKARREPMEPPHPPEEGSKKWWE